jgi:type I restriction enzyme S subunit
MRPGTVSLAELKFVPEAAAPAISRYRIFGGDVFVSVAGTLGIVGRVPPQLHGANLTENADRITNLTCSQGYLLHVLASPLIQRAIDSIRTVGAQPKLALSRLRKFAVPLPPRSEQDAIAAALDDVDALLDGLTRLIAKKRDLKQAAMQQLLTGRTRLPGFVSKWRVRRLGDHATFLKGGAYARAELSSASGVKYLHYGDIHVASDVRLDVRLTAMPFLDESRARRLDGLIGGDVVFVDASEDVIGIGKSVEILQSGDTRLVAGLHTIAVRFDKTVLADGFKAYLQCCPPFVAHLRRLAAGTKVYATTRGHIASVEMPLPDIQEQTAIATVLSDMDSELAALEARRAKTQSLKQAMMQSLLTGRIRLVTPEPAHA